MIQAQSRNIPGNGRRDLNVDIYRPDPDKSLHSAVILLHGGGWRFGSRAMVAPFAAALAELGFLAAGAEYRLRGEAPFPAMLEDVRDTVAWLRGQSTNFDIDPSKIALEGFSAGGHLALLAAGSYAQRPESRVAAVVSLFAPTNLEGPAPPGMPTRATMLLGDAATPAEIAAASPIHLAGPGFPPTFLLHGMADTLLPPSETLRLFDALVAANCAVDLHLYHAHTHEFAALPSMLGPVQAEVALFLKRSVVDPEGHAAENLKLNPFANPHWRPQAPPVTEPSH
jgi:acetyl esterase/lipase